MGERVLSGIECRDPACKRHSLGGGNICPIEASFIGRVYGRTITNAEVRTDHAGNVIALELKLDDGQQLAVDPEVNGDRIMVTLAR